MVVKLKNVEKIKIKKKYRKMLKISKTTEKSNNK